MGQTLASADRDEAKTVPTVPTQWVLLNQLLDLNRRAPINSSCG
jgi:hypothetical protein